ncbi:MAG: hypothetical protein ACRDF7_04495 [Candidatus Limnocylindrales bacterium]
MDASLRRAEVSGDADLRARVASLLAFTHLFDRAVGAVVASDASAIAHLFKVLGRLDSVTIQRLASTLATIPEADLAEAARTIASMRPSLARRAIGLLSSPPFARLAGRRT